MVSTEKRGAEIRQFLLENVEKHPGDIVSLTAETFGISRQGVHRHVQRLCKDKLLEVSGTTRNRRYKLHPGNRWVQRYPLDTLKSEALIWSRDIRPLLDDLPANVLTIWGHSFTEMLNNAMEHSAGKNVVVSMNRMALGTRMVIWDNGEGIFKKLQRELALDDERHAVLELTKGKVTTKPAGHSGEGIFFTSRMLDDFAIVSGNVCFNLLHGKPVEAGGEQAIGWIGEHKTPAKGTVVYMALSNHTTRTTKEVFERYTVDEGQPAFAKTAVPVRLAQYGDDKLVSRSQGKRLLAGLDRFSVVILDFAGVDMIGQAFADEVFRVFADAHPAIELAAVNAQPDVAWMIRHVAGDRREAILGYQGGC
jgi:anti-sigma regulatory factor (Ser/Thr protein kinase)